MADDNVGAGRDSLGITDGDVPDQLALASAAEVTSPPPLPTDPAGRPYASAGAGRRYFSIRLKFFAAQTFAFLWTSMSLFVAIPWMTNISHMIGWPATIFGVFVLP
jgi:hypothetical protein